MLFYMAQKDRDITRAKTILFYVKCRIRIDFFESDKRICIGERERSDCNIVKHMGKGKSTVYFIAHQNHSTTGKFKKEKVGVN